MMQKKKWGHPAGAMVTVTITYGANVVICFPQRTSIHYIIVQIRFQKQLQAT